MNKLNKRKNEEEREKEAERGWKREKDCSRSCEAATPGDRSVESSEKKRHPFTSEII